jgi:hypothetical protein
VRSTIPAGSFAESIWAPYNEDMARGFESKSVEAQQEEAARERKSPRPAMSPEDRIIEQRRRTLELTRTRARQDLSRATAPAHKRMLEQAIATLDQQLRDVGVGS